jgi:hypothetical protein
MPTKSKFVAETRTKIIQALSVGASRRTAAHIAGVDEATLRRWCERGKGATEGRYAEFLTEVLKAEASPRMRALGVVYKDLPDNPMLAWKYVERKEPGYAPPMPNMAPSAAPVVIQLSLSDGSMPPILGAPPALVDGIIEGEIVDVEDDEPGAAEAPAT